MKIRCVSNTYSDLQFEISQTEQFPLLRFDSDTDAQIKSLHNAIKLLKDDTDAVIPISIKATTRKVSRSVLSTEIIAFADLFDDAYSFMSQIEQTLVAQIPLHLHINSKQIFDIISKGPRITEKKITVDIHAI